MERLYKVALSIIVCAIIMALALGAAMQLGDKTTKIKATVNISLAELFEAGYLFGQAENINGSTRIKYNEKLSCWEWIRSPWDSGRQPTYDNCEGKR